MFGRTSRVAVTVSAWAVAALTITLPAAPSAAAPAAPVASAVPVASPSGTHVAATSAMVLDLKEDCETRDEATRDPGWFPDRYAHCRRGDGMIIVLNQQNIPVGEIHFDIMILGFGNNGAREVNYLVYLDDWRKVGAPDLSLDAAVVSVWFSCDVSLLPCADPSSGARTDTVLGWRAVDFFSTTLTSPEVPGAGEQIVRKRFALTIGFATPGQPYLSGPPQESGYSNVRYDSASYVGRARGAVFTDYRLIFEVSLSIDNQDESALHIRHAVDFPELTFPSWLGKSVPGEDDEPLTRMYNPADNDANRRKSEALCRELYGTWDSSLVNCDEFPFASTYEGSKTGPERNGGYDRFSVRLIDAADNQYVGRQMLEVEFYRVNRVLDGDRFVVHVVR